jgi:hypothetical protein
MNMDTGLVLLEHVSPKKEDVWRSGLPRCKALLSVTDHEYKGSPRMEWHCAIIGLLAGKRAASRHDPAWITGIGIKI